MEITKKIYSEISAGELFDKITILEIKKNKIKEKSKRNIVLKELGSLQEAVNENIEKSKSLTKLYKKLKSVNLKLWKIEDDIRDCERKKKFIPRYLLVSYLIKSLFLRLKKIKLKTEVKEILS